MPVMEKPTKEQLTGVINLLKQYDDAYNSPLAMGYTKMNKAVEFFHSANGKESYMKQVISLLEAMNR